MFLWRREGICRFCRFPRQKNSVGSRFLHISLSLTPPQPPAVSSPHLRGSNVVTKLPRLIIMMSMRSRSIRMMANLTIECKVEVMEKSRVFLGMSRCQDL